MTPIFISAHCHWTICAIYLGVVGSKVLVNAFDRTSVIVFALQMIVGDSSNPGNAIDQNSPVHVFWARMRLGWKEEHDPAEREKDHSCQVDGQAPTTQTEATRQKCLLHNSLASHAPYGNDI